MADWVRDGRLGQREKAAREGEAAEGETDEGAEVEPHTQL